MVFYFEDATRFLLKIISPVANEDGGVGNVSNVSRLLVSARRKTLKEEREKAKK